jgi:hypothetical protein
MIMTTEQAIKLIRTFDACSSDLTSLNHKVYSEKTRIRIKRAYQKARRELFKALADAYPTVEEEQAMDL